MGDALKQFAYDLQGLDPIVARRPQAPPKATIEPEKPKRAMSPPVKWPEGNAEWRKLFIGRSMRNFTTAQVLEALGYTKSSASSGSLRKRIDAALAEMPEVSVTKEAKHGPKGHPRQYHFDPSATQPRLKRATPPQPKKVRKLHALRQIGAKKPKPASPQMRELVDMAWSQGWLVTLTGGGHLQFVPPDESTKVFAPSTPSDVRGVENARAELRRAGLET